MGIGYGALGFRHEVLGTDIGMGTGNLVTGLSITEIVLGVDYYLHHTIHSIVHVMYQIVHTAYNTIQ